MNRKWIRIAALVLTMIFVLGTVAPAAAAKKKSKTSITVTTQEELVKALKSGKYKKITIRTDEKVTFALAAKYSNSDLKIVVDAPNATFKSKGTFGSIVVNEAKTVKEYASGNNITINDEKLTINVMDGASPEKLKIASETGQIKIVNNGEIGRLDVTGESSVAFEQNGSVGRLYVGAAGKISVTGTTDEKLAVTVKPEADGARITSEIPVKTNLYCNAELVLQQGAENSGVTVKNETAGVKLENNTGKKVTVTESEGWKIVVGKGDDFDNRKATGSEDSSGTGESDGTKETGSGNDPDPGEPEDLPGEPKPGASEDLTGDPNSGPPEDLTGDPNSGPPEDLTDDPDSDPPEDLTGDPDDNNGDDEGPETAMRVEVKNSEITVNGKSVPDGQVAGVSEDGTVVLLSADEKLNALQKELNELFSDNSLASFLGPDGASQNLEGTKLEELILALEQYNFAGFTFNIDGTATVVAFSPMDLRLSGNVNTLLVGPDAPGINVIQERGQIGNMLVLDPESNIFLGGNVQNLYAAETVTRDTLHTHTPAQKTVYVVEPTYTEDGQYTIVTYCTDPSCSMELDSKTYYTDKLTPPEPDPEPDPCANGHTGGTADCQNKAVCTVCKQPYGELGAHSPGSKEYAEATPDGRPYTVHCSVCGETLEEGLEPLPEPDVEPDPEPDPCANGHTGGTADCQNKAVCTVCKQPYGELGAHSPGSKEYAEATPDGRPYTVHCSVCGETLEEGLEPLPEPDAEPEPETDPCANGHTGGTADCQNKAVCTVCKQPYGELGAHSPGSKEYAEATPDGRPYTVRCSVCGGTLETGLDPLPNPQPDAGSCANGHTGGTADCQNKAVCTVCGQSYGELGNHIPGEKVYTLVTEDGKQYEIRCTVCSELLDEGMDPPDPEESGMNLLDEGMNPPEE